MDSIEPPVQLPALHARRAVPVAERTRYVARAGMGALPSGLGTILLFITPQLLSLGFLLWAIWWPYPSATRTLVFAWGCTTVLVGLLVLVAWLLIRRHPGFLMGVIQAPFVRITVTDRRVLWTVPWAAAPLIEIDRRRVRGALLGAVDGKGRGNAAMMLVPGDPMGDEGGHIHFDRLPQAERFVAALAE